MSNRIPVNMKTKIYKIYIIPILLIRLRMCYMVRKTFSNDRDISKQHHANIIHMITSYRLKDNKISTLRNLTSLCPPSHIVKSKSLNGMACKVI